MPDLTELQVLHVKHNLHKRGLTYAPLSVELLDHVCTDIEDKMAKGKNFNEAFELCCTVSFSKQEIKKTQNSIYSLVNRKYTIMKNLTTLTGTFAASFLVFVLFINATDQPSIKPFHSADNIKLSSPFGMRFHPILKANKEHKGIDFSMPIGTPILAAGDGIVVETANNTKGYGIFIKIKHDDSFITSYAQLSKIQVKVGQQVKKGVQIALSGNSGASTAPHLHYEVIKNGKNVDPAQYLGEAIEK